MSIEDHRRSRLPEGASDDDIIQAAIYMRRGDYSKSLPYLQRAVAQEPGVVEFWSALGLTHAKLGDSKKALACYEKCLAMNSTDPITLNIAGALHYEVKNYNRAMELLTISAALEPKSPEPFYNMGLVSLAQGNKEKALDFFEKALATAPGHYKAWRSKSFVLAGQKKSKEADDCLREASFIADAKISFATGKFEKTVAIRRREALLHPNNPRTLVNLGYVLRAAGRLAESVEVYKKAVALDPDSAETHICLATTLLTAGDFKNGLERV